MSDSDPWKAAQQGHLKTLEMVTEIYDHDPDRAGQIVEEIIRILEHHLGPIEDPQMVLEAADLAS